MDCARYKVKIVPSLMLRWNQAIFCAELGPMLGLGQVLCSDWAIFNFEIGPGVSGSRPNIIFEPGPMWVLGQVQCPDWARFEMGIGPSFHGSRPNVGIGPGSMWGLGQDQCGDGARPNVDIELAYFW